MRSISIRPHVGQEISVAALEERPNTFSNSRATLISCTGSALSDTRIVFPMPADRSVPRPAELLMEPANNVPDSVIPR